MSSGPGSWFFFSSCYFQSCVVDKLGHVTYKMVPFPALITVDHFVSAIRQAAHTINLEAGCERFAWVMQRFC